MPGEVVLNLAQTRVRTYALERGVLDAKPTVLHFIKLLSTKMNMSARAPNQNSSLSGSPGRFSL